MELYEELEARRAEIERHKENAARMAWTYASYKSTGIGSIEFKKRADFGLTFIEKPYISFGWEIDLDELDDLLGAESEVNDVPAMPLVSSYVTEWDRDDRGFYVGAWVGTRVWFPPDPVVPVDTPVEIRHHFTFAAIAMKDIPLDVRE